MQIKNDLSKESVERLSKLVHRMIITEPQLTNRNKRQIFRWILKKQIHIAFHQGKVIGFIVSEPIDTKYSEIKSWYVSPNYRNKQLGIRLLNTATRFAKVNYLLSSFDKSSTEKLYKHNFKIISYTDLPKDTVIRLLLSKRISSIAKHLFTQKSYLLCKHANI